MSTKKYIKAYRPSTQANLKDKNTKKKIPQHNKTLTGNISIQPRQMYITKNIILFLLPTNIIKKKNTKQ